MTTTEREKTHLRGSLTVVQGQLTAERQEITKLREQLTQEENEIRDLRVQLNAREHDSNDLRGQLTAFEQEITVVRAQMSKKQQEYKDFLGQLNTSGQEITNLRGRMTATEQENRNLRDQMSSREQEVINLKGRLTSKDQEVTNLQAQLTDREQEVRDLGSQLTTREQDINNLQSQLIARERETRVQLTEREQAITNLQSEVNETRQEITNLRNQLIERERQITVGRDNQEGSHSSRSHNLRPHDWEIRKTEIFLMDEVLGEGASGRVVRGKFRGCNVAVKQIHPALLTYRHIRDSFKREVDFASRSRHPCLLQFIGATIDGAEPMLVTELLDRSLRSLYEERSLIDKEISDISHDVALVLNYLHEQKPQPIIHRDISSANVLLWQHGDHWRGKVSDYGTANFVRECSTDDPGAPIYCAPEILPESRDQTISCKVSYNTSNPTQASRNYSQRGSHENLQLLPIIYRYEDR